MASQTKAAKTSERHLLSHTTVLLLSGFLITFVAGGSAGLGMGWVLLLAGTVGLSLYLSLDFVARRRRDDAVKESTGRIENRMDRHLDNDEAIQSKR
jgi:hypothetical protein